MRGTARLAFLLLWTMVVGLVSYTFALSTLSSPSGLAEEPFSLSSASSAASVPNPFSSSSSSSPPPPAPVNIYSLPGTIINRPILKPKADPNDVFGTYDKVQWWPLERPKAIISPAEEDDYSYEESEVQDGKLLRALKKNLKEEAGFSPEWDWARNKTILTIGDSINRNNLAAFALHTGTQRRTHTYDDNPLGSKWQVSQSMGVVDADVDGLSLKIANWFHQGMIENDLDTFYKGENLPQRFEQKLESVFLPSLSHPKGLDGRQPDLIVFETLTWDLVLLARLSHAAGDQRFEGRPLDDIEIEWYKGRVITVLNLLQRTFPQAKIVIQTPHHGSRPESHVFSSLRAFQQGQALHAVSRQTGHQLFDWGRIVSPLTNELEDGLHFRPGAATWMWGEMVLHYLRAISQSPSPVFSASTLDDASSVTTSSTISHPHISQQQLLQSYKSERKIPQTVAKL